MPAELPGSVTVTRRFDCPTERVFDAWLDPALAAKFLFATATGTMVRADIDPRVGGAYNLTDRRDGVDVEHCGTYQEIERPRRLAFTFGVPKYSPDFTRVSIDIKPLANGCELTLTNEGIPAEWVEPTRKGWGMILDGLATVLG